MQRLSLVAAGVAVSVLVSFAQRQPSPPFTTSSDLVVVPTVVADRKGALVRGLDVAAFQVFEDGTRLPIEALVRPDDRGAGADGRFIVIVLDNLRTRAEVGARVKSIAGKLVFRMGPSDMVSAITLDRGRWSSVQTPAEVRAAINRFRPRRSVT